MTTKSLPGYFLKAVPNIAEASTGYLNAYASIILQSIHTHSDQIADAHAQLMLFNARLIMTGSTANNTEVEDLFRIPMALQVLRDEITQLILSLPEMHDAADEADRILCAVEVIAEVARRVTLRGCLTKNVSGAIAA